MNLHKKLLGIVSLLVLVAAVTSNTSAQSLQTGDVTGVITDPSGAVVPGVSVTLTSKDTGQNLSATTNSVGAYRFPLEQPGAYTLKVAGTNYQAATRDIRVAVGQTTTTNIQLTLQSSSQEVTVTAEASVVQADNPNLSTTMSTEQVHLVPNGGGDLSYVAQTAPGAAMNSEGGFGNFSTFGLPAISNNFTYNSMPENDPFLNLNNSGATNILLGQNDVSEATIVNNGYSGEYSMAGANVNYVSRSGTNSFHGNANYYWNGRILNANNFFNKQSEPAVPRGFVNDNQWAASFGGPIKKDKTFFFVDTEGLRLIIPVNDTINVPSQAFETTTLANISAKQPAEVGLYQNMFNLWNSAPGAGGAANTLADGGCADFAGTPGFGAASPCALSYHRSVPNLTTEWLLTARVDHNFSDKDKAFIHFRRDYGLQATYTDPINPAFNITSKQPQYEGQVQETHVFSPATVNSLVVSGSYYRAIFTHPDQTAALALMPLQVAFPGQSSTTSGTFWSLGNDYQSPFPSPQGRNVTQYGFVDDVSHTMGAHTLKVGGNFARYDITDFAPGVNSLPALAGEALTDFFNGVGTSFTQAFPTRTSQPIALYHLGFYGSDEWKARKDLKLTLSLRVDRSSNPVCQTDCFSTLAGPFNTIDHSLTTPYNQTVLANQSQAIPGNYHSFEFEPRFGFNWSPFGSNNLVVSGGFGMFSDVIPAGFVDNLIRNLPSDPQFTLPGFPFAPGAPGSAQSAAAAAASALQTGFPAGATWAGLNSAVLGATGGVSGFAPPNIFNVGSDFHVPRFQEWDLQVQQALDQKTVVSIKYVGNHGIHEQILNGGVNAYCGPTVSSTALLSAGSSGAPTPCLTALGFSNFAGLPSLPADPRFLGVSELSTGYNSNYNGMTASVMRRLSSFQFQVNYTWSHALDFSSNNGVGGNGEPFNIKSNLSVSNPQNPANVTQNMYGNADYDIRHYLSMNYVYTTPAAWRQGLVGSVLGNWTISGTAFWHTGLPFSVVDLGTGTVLSGFGFGGITGAGISPTLANQTGGGVMTCNGQFANPANGPCPALVNNFTPDVNGFGDQRRNQVYGPKFFDTDLSIMKNFKIPGREGMNLSVGATAYNVFNHPNFDQPVGFIGTGGFGSIVTTVNAPTSIYGSFLGGDASPRLIQLQAKFNF